MNWYLLFKLLFKEIFRWTKMQFPQPTATRKMMPLQKLQCNWTNKSVINIWMNNYWYKNLFQGVVLTSYLEEENYIFSDIFYIWRTTNARSILRSLFIHGIILNFLQTKNGLWLKEIWKNLSRICCSSLFGFSLHYSEDE